MTGKLCETDINECFSGPCVKGVCIDGEDNYSCTCDQGKKQSKHSYTFSGMSQYFFTQDSQLSGFFYHPKKIKHFISLSLSGICMT